MQKNQQANRPKPHRAMLNGLVFKESIDCARAAIE
jgi:hypothetical protein